MSAQQPGLGRRYAPDARDHAYLLRAAEATRLRRNKTWPLFSRHLDQGATGTCVGHAFRHLLTGTPVPRRDLVPSAFDIYDAAIKADEWSENDNDTARQFGTSVRAGAKALQALGLISAYGWAYDLDTALDWLSWHGPLVGGFNWYDTFFDRDKDGFLRLTPRSRLVGGHCILIVGVDLKRQAVRCLTSWRDFGYFFLSFDDFARLLREDGELCSPTEAQHGKAAQP